MHCTLLDNKIRRNMLHSVVLQHIRGIKNEREKKRRENHFSRSKNEGWYRISVYFSFIDLPYIMSSFRFIFVHFYFLWCQMFYREHIGVSLAHCWKYNRLYSFQIVNHIWPDFYFYLSRSDISSIPYVLKECKCIASLNYSVTCFVYG